MSQPSAPELAAQGGVRPAQRLVSLDVFRGFVIASMLLVNGTWGEEGWGTGLGQAAAMQLAHVPWNAPAQGATFTDLVFPWFIFILGAAIPLSMSSGRGAGTPAWRKLLKAARRGVVLYLLGVLLTHAGHWFERPMRWTDLASWNILQLLGMAYVASVAVGLLPRKLWWVFIALVLVAKGAIMLAIPADWLRETLAAGGLEPRVAPGSGVEPAGGITGHGTFTHFDDVKRYLNREHIDASGSALAAWDRFGLGWIGMWQQVLPCAAIAMGGALATDWLRSARSAGQRIGGLAMAGAVVWLIGFVLQIGSGTSGGGLLGPLTIPFSKWFFSPSYCLLSIGTGAVLLALTALIIDAARWTWAGGFFRVLGMNALFLYVGNELAYKVAFGRWLMPIPGGGQTTVPGAINAWAARVLPDGTLASWPAVGGAEAMAGSLSWAAISGLAWPVVWIAGWWLLCRWLDRRQMYIRV